MGTCEYFEALLSQSLDEALSPGEGQALSAHLAGCPRCRETERQLAQLSQALRDWEDRPAPADLTARVMDRVGRLERPAKAVPFLRRPAVRAWGSLAACALLCAGLLRLALPAAPEGAAPMAVAAEDPSAADPQALREGLDVPDGPLERSVRSEPFLFSASTQKSDPDTDSAGAPAPLPDSGLLLQSARAALGAEPGSLLVLDALPGGLELEGDWLTTQEGWLLTELDESLPQEARQALADAALLLLTQGAGPAVLLLLG